jgi:molecular chaperone GrpE (heat shock protein)
MTNQDPNIPPAVPAAEGATPEGGGAPDRLDRLERLVRGVSRDNLELQRGQQEVLAAVAAMRGRMEDLDLTLKGVAQTVGRAVQEGQAGVQNAEKHFAGALRELEARVREEMQWQIQRGALQAVFPAVDDLELIIAHERQAAGGAVPAGSVLEALVMVRQKMMDGLRSIGLDEIAVEPGVTRFDPAVHQLTASDLAAGAVPDLDVPRDTILILRRPGYRFQGRVFRAPQVIVKL